MSEMPSPPADEAPDDAEAVAPDAAPERSAPADSPGRTADGGEAPEAGAAPGSEERISTLEDRLKRTQAEFVNESKRIRRQAEDRIRYATEELVRDLLPVFDALHSARDGFAAKAASDHTALAALDGFDLVEKELINVLSRHGVARIDAEPATPFDPNLHHAIVMMDVAELEPGTIAKELRPGFQLHQRVVRPAHVAVVAEQARTGATGSGDDEEGADEKRRGGEE